MNTPEQKYQQTRRDFLKASMLGALGLAGSSCIGIGSHAGVVENKFNELAEYAKQTSKSGKPFVPSKEAL